MKNKIVMIVKNLCIALIILYSLNVLLDDINIFIPLNVFSIGISTILGIPGIIALILLNIFIV